MTNNSCRFLENDHFATVGSEHTTRAGVCETYCCSQKSTDPIVMLKKKNTHSNITNHLKNYKLNVAHPVQIIVTAETFKLKNLKPENMWYVLRLPDERKNSYVLLC